MSRAELLSGWVCGWLAALIWAGFQVLTKHGLSGAGGGGFRPMELQLLRFGVPGLLMLPVVLARGLPEVKRLGWLRLMALSLCSGPLLGLANFMGYSLAPLSHGAVLAPAFSTLWGAALSALFLRSRLAPVQYAGLALIVAGLVVVGGVQSGSWSVRLGDSLFCVSGMLWGMYTVLLRRWKIGGLLGPAVSGLWSSVFSIGLFVCFADVHHLLAIPSRPFWTQAIFQSVFAGALAVIAIGYSVQYLGAARAALFPASVPVLALTVGVIAFDATVSPVQWAGLAVTTAGLLMALGVFNSWRAGWPYRTRLRSDRA